MPRSTPARSRTRGVLGRGRRGHRLDRNGTRCSTRSNAPFYRWFAGGAAQHLLQRARPPRRRRAAASRPRSSTTARSPARSGPITYRAAARTRSARFAGALARARRRARATASSSTCRWCPRRSIAMLACARIGAIHSVVFGGFAAQRAGERASTTPSRRSIVSASCGIEAGPRRRLQAAARRGDRRWRRHKPAALPDPAAADGERASSIAGPRPRLGRGDGHGARRTTACRSRRPIRSTSSTPPARPGSRRASCATTAATRSRSTGR